MYEERQSLSKNVEVYDIMLSINNSVYYIFWYLYCFTHMVYDSGINILVFFYKTSCWQDLSNVMLIYCMMT